MKAMNYKYSGWVEIPNQIISIKMFAAIYLIRLLFEYECECVCVCFVLSWGPEFYTNSSKLMAVLLSLRFVCHTTTNSVIVVWRR